MISSKPFNCKCEVCNKDLYRKPYQLKKNEGKAFCSMECFNRRNYSPKICPICSLPFSGNKDRITCSRACSNKSRTGKLYKIGSPNDRVSNVKKLKVKLLLERGNACELCKFDNINVLQVHHIVERKNGGSDDLENLKLLCPNCHCTIHYGDSRNLEK